MLLDSLKESPLLSHELGSYSPVQRLPDRIAKEGSDQPAEKGSAKGGDAHRDERVQGNDLRDPVGYSGRDGDREAAAGQSQDRGEDRRGE